ncbi:hypothetical protein VCUG_00873 [Vavraia culicis subsp. floridensis]|uniref:Uncharacterized protein n=1 Tax=Vavraia culicis (isolate floridensis) TaxID=948595 RepID=L2GWC6_VAVCU|nr:uncharacterized protein VCUG_00873 [Vavraia culicis subsp. floridensis]ELA47672.1 hypothetical protein VCUG_00873 [Vavraia culicis subsp. floridensis]
MLTLFFSLSYCYYGKDVLGFYKTDKPPFNVTARYLKPYDQRNHEDNVNFRKSDEIVQNNPEPSYFEQQVQIAGMLDTALSGYRSDLNKFKHVDDKMNNIRAVIKENECVMNEQDLDEEPLNVVSWLYHNNKEEEKIDKDLQREVENNIIHAKEKRDRIMRMEEDHLKDRRSEDREHKNRFLQWARHEYNVK